MSYSPQILSTVGLLLDIFGVIVLFVFGWPQPDLRDEELIWSNESRADDPAHQRKKFLHKTMAVIGLSCLVVGFILQIMGTWAVPANKSRPTSCGPLAPSAHKNLRKPDDHGLTPGTNPEVLSIQMRSTAASDLIADPTV